MPTREEMFSALGNCWTKEFGELELRVFHTLTEPTCPTAIIATEGGDGPSWRVDCDSIAEAVDAVLLVAYITLIERKPKPLTFPAPDANEDQKVAAFLAALDAKYKEHK